MSAPEKATIAVRNRLATSEPSQVSPASIAEDLLAFGVNGKAARGLLLGIYKEAYQHFLQDDTISDTEAGYLANLKRIFTIANTEALSVETEIVHPRLGRLLSDVLLDDRINTSERIRMREFASQLRLPADVVNRLLSERVEARINVAVTAATADQRLSPTELDDLHALAANLGTELTVSANTWGALQRMQLLWQVDNGHLPVVHVPINLQKNEVCHGQLNATWYESRTRTVRVNYGGPVASIRICKGLRYRVGSVTAQRIAREELTLIDNGTLYLTNKRLIFDGVKKNTAIRLAGLLSFTPFTDGVILEKNSGRPIHLILSGGDIELFQAMLSAAMNVA